MENHGKIILKVDKVLQKRQISRTKLMYLAYLQRKQVNKLADGSATRIDLDVLARLCHALDCDVSDLLEYIPKE